MISLDLLLQRWQRDVHFMDCVAAWHTLPPRPALLADWPSALDPRVINAVRRRGIDRLYQHQAEAVSAALAQQHITIVTATASGKTLAYNAPVLHTLLNNPTARALYLFPTKALAQDQVVAFNDLAAALDEPSKIQAATYDGDTPQNRRKHIRESARVIVSNPDMLHVSVLPHHPRWRRFLANLRYLVIDELHTYRGAFGSHLANVLRRLWRICRFYGSDPQVICASATIANPFEHTLNILDLAEPHRLQVVDQNGAPQAEKHLIFYNPPIVDEDLAVRRGAVVTVNDLARDLLGIGAQTVIFARARLTVEVLLSYLRDFAAEQGWPPEQIRGYRGGYLPLERREIETGLRQGAVQGVVATNALELGVDIGGLNACLLTGYPGTIAGTWQQIGRVGRRDEASLAVFVASQSPLDQFLMQHPDFFFERRAEHARIDPDNPMIALAHLQCAAYELPFRRDEPFGRFPDPATYLDFLVEEGSLRQAADTYHWMGEGSPAQQVSLREAGMTNVVITVVPDGETIGHIDLNSAPSFVYPGAIYLHEGRTFQITNLDLHGGRADATSVVVGYYTRALQDTHIEILESEEETADEMLAWGRGLVRVTRHVTGYQQVRRYTHEVIGFGDVDLPPRSFDTSGYWVRLTEASMDALSADGILLGPLDYGPVQLWQERRNAARARDNYMCQLCGRPESAKRQHDVHHRRPLREFLREAAARGVDPAGVYPEAHALDNLITLCPSCHKRAEVVVRTANAWAGLAHALENLAPLYVMCDPRDISVNADSRLDQQTLPTITIFDNTPMGLGFADQLYDLHAQLLSDALALIRDCRCRRGCPVCVGPPPHQEANLRQETEHLLQTLINT